MTDTTWEIEGREFTHCNCAYGCPCQFNALPTHGNCQGLMGVVIDRGRHGDTRLDGLKFASVVSFPKAIHEGHGESLVIIDERADAAQRNALLRIVLGEDTEPGATIFQVFSTVIEKLYEPVFAPIEFDIDIPGRKAAMKVPGVLEARGAPIVNPVTKAEYRGRIDLPSGFEYLLAEVGRGWGSMAGPITFRLEDSHAHFAPLHMTQSGVVR